MLKTIIMIQMSKEEFTILLERQRSSGLSIKDFCANEVYTESSFYYWKSKFGYSRSYRTHQADTSIEQFAPVSLYALSKLRVVRYTKSLRYPMPSQGFYILMDVVDVNDFVVFMDFKVSLLPLSYPAVSPLYL